ncbi:MAG: methylated-DNA--[protein]-cysteine S-methyltransferase [Bacteroidetes bacterium]|nr:methylated-DNA--[protein]-cysteine S-methyltransferase [Bacteroidota bacterium]
MELHTAYYSSPIGTLEIKGNEAGLQSLLFLDEPVEATEKVHESIKEVTYQLDEYFIEFQKKVWKELQEIPFGKTWSYLDIALKLGDENATRAVGSANGKNPVAIIVPCHRVIGSSGKLTGYAGGLWRKEWLLKHEQGVIFGKQTELF